MSSKRPRGDAWEYTFKKAGVLEKPLYLTFATEAEGDAYAKKLDALLDRGIVPTEHQAVNRILTIESLARMYMRDAHVKPKDQDVLGTICNAVGTTALASINAAWVDGWISDMKRVDKLAPSTLRSKVGALARCTDWGMRKGLLLMPDHPLRTLPDGYAQYTKLDESMAGAKKEDVERDRRLESGEFEKILAVFQVGVLARKQRPYTLEYKAALQAMLLLAVESAMRLREMYTLTLDQVDLPRRTIFLDKTKNGDKRQVPLSSVALGVLETYLKARDVSPDSPKDAVFPWWTGTTERRPLAKTSDYLSKLYGNIFKDAGCVDLTFHDLRHEATSRLFEKTRLSETEIMKITGHKSHRMLMRYANLRGSNLADKLW
jgi:integrase